MLGSNCLSLIPTRLYFGDQHLTSYQNINCSLTMLEVTINNIDHPDYWLIKIVTSVYMTALLSFSIGPLASLWHFERFGGDPQKRTILNQLIGVMALNALVALFFCTIVFLFRVALGPLPIPVAVATFFVPNFIAGTVVILMLNEIILIRFLSVFWWKQLPPLNDGFFGIFFHWMNYGLATYWAALGQMGGNPNDSMFFIMTGFIHHRVTELSLPR